jgi:hypothetical protein
LPFDIARTFEWEEADSPQLWRVETCVRQCAADHPYLLFDHNAIGRIRQIAASDARLQARFVRSLDEATLGDGIKDIRTQVKQCARRLITTAFVGLIADGPRKDQALTASRQILTELAAATTWKKRQVIRSFLDCAETAVAVSFAYDWLYHDLPADERQAIEKALFRHVIDPALAAFDDKSLLWPRRRDNCCLVSNCGITIAALAMLPNDRRLASTLVRRSIASAWNAFAAFAPDGAWPEGPSYWSLAVRNASLMIAALESALGDSFGLAERPGFATTGDFALHAAGPFGAAFDFGDSVRRYDFAALAWLAHRFRRPIDGWLIDDYDGWHLPLTMIWPPISKAGPGELQLPTGKVFRGADVACFRNTWQNDAVERPVYLAIKGGNSRRTVGSLSPRPENTILHAQADAGSFIVDGARVRWAIDLGADDYDLPGYFDHGSDCRNGARWQYYRVRTDGHNTLVIDGLNQDPCAQATILGSCVDGVCKWIVYDLSAVYRKPAGSVRRGAALIGRQVVISDEFDPTISGDVMWTMHTSAEPVSVMSRSASFRRGRDRLVARILEPENARFKLTLPPAPRWFSLEDPGRVHGPPKAVHRGARVRELPRRDDDGDRRGAGAIIRRLQIRLPVGARRLTVLLLPDWDEVEDAVVPVAPLDYWLARRPLRLAPYIPTRAAKKRGRQARGAALNYVSARIGLSGGIPQPSANRV